MRKTGLKVMAIAAAMAMGVAGCGSSATASSTTAASSTAAGDVSEIGDITLIMSSRDQFRSMVESAASEAAASMGINLVSQDAQDDTNKMLSFIETARNAGQKAVIVNMIDPNTTAQCIEAAGDMKIVFVNRMPENMDDLTENSAVVSSEEKQAGIYQGEYLSEYFKEQGKTDVNYLMISGTLGMNSTTDRSEYPITTMKENGLNPTAIQADLACEWDRAEAMNQVSTVLASGAEFDCIIANNDEMALGAIEAMKNANMDPSSVPVVGIDATADGCAAIQEGTMAMTVFQDPIGQGRGALMACVNLINGTPLNEGTEYELDETGRVMWVPFEPVTADNVADYAS